MRWVLKRIDANEHVSGHGARQSLQQKSKRCVGGPDRSKPHRKLGEQVNGQKCHETPGNKTDQAQTRPVAHDQRHHPEADEQRNANERGDRQHRADVVSNVPQAFTETDVAPQLGEVGEHGVGGSCDGQHVGRKPCKNESQQPPRHVFFSPRIELDKRMTRYRLILPFAMLLAAVTPLPSSAQPAAQPVWPLETVTADLQQPWGLAFLPDGSLLVTELPGRLRHVTNGTVSEPLDGVPAVYFASQGGLFDVVLHPEFESNRWLYLTYAQGTPDDNGTAVARAVWRNNTLHDVQEIFRVKDRKDTAAHYGGRLAFLPDGTMLLTTGDGFTYRTAAQNLSSQLGKTLRMNDDGSPAAGNPFRDAPYVWTYGHRNPQGLAVASNGDVWLHEHGPQGGDELNLLKPGKNYGWPAICHCLDYTGAYVTPFTHWDGMEQPKHYWRPSIAPSGLALFENQALIGALNDAEVRVVPLAGGEETAWFSDVGQRVRDVRVSPDGAVYLTVEGGEGGRVLRATRPSRATAATLSTALSP